MMTLAPSIAMSAGLVPAAPPVDKIAAPAVNLVAIMPILIVLGAAVVAVVFEAALPRGRRFYPQVALAVAAIIAALVWTIVAGAQRYDAVTFAGAIAVDSGTYVMWGTLLALALVSVILMADRVTEPGGAFVAQAAAIVGSRRDRRDAEAATPMQTEVFPLTLFAAGGMLVFPAASDLLTLFVALEALSLPLYLLCGLARRRRLISQEAAVKYFLIGAFTSAILLYGIALLYGYAGSVRFSVIAEAASAAAGSDVLLLAGIGLLVIGLLYKASVGPFHLWTPDVYQGAPTSVTAFMGACTKLAAFAALLRVLQVALGPIAWSWKPVLYVVAVISMLIGALIGLVQSDFKRMLAYSSVAHAGFFLLGVMALSARGFTATMFYLVTYGFATIGAFAIITVVRRGSQEAWQMSHWAGLAKRSPLLAGAMTLFLLSFAGIPLTSGFIGKLAVFSAAMDSGMAPLVVIAMIITVITAVYYLRVVVLMYFRDPEPAPVAGSLAGGSASGAGGSVATLESTHVIAPGTAVTIVVAVCAIITVLLGIVPQLGLDLLHVQFPLLS